MKKRKLWTGPLAYFGIPAGDRRMFSAGALGARPMPLPLLWQEKTETSHGGSVIVGRILLAQEADELFMAGGDWLPPAKFPYVEKAMELVDGGVVGPSVDLEPDLTVALDFTLDPERPILNYQRATVMGATLVPMAAFGGPRLQNHDVDPDDFKTNALIASLRESDDIEEWLENWSPFPGYELVPAPGATGFPPNRTLIQAVAHDHGFQESTFTVNGSSWRSLPIAERDVQFDADDAAIRILAWAKNDRNTAAKAYLWNNPQIAAATKDTYRLPLGDIFGGKLTLMYHAVYAAAALLSGAHGGLPNISDEEKGQLRRVISDIYSKMSEHFGDPEMQAPWDARAEAAKRDKMSIANAVVAAAAPVNPPRAWFADPHFAEKTPVRIDEHGHFSGHIACWGTCHTGFTGECVTVPRSKSGYAYFMTGEVLTAEGEYIPVGTITMGTGHADTAWGPIQALAHYDNTGTQVVAVTCGEDEFGIWANGSLVPGLPEERVAELRRSPLSGDWRRIRGNMELIRALAVNSPGFPVLRSVGTRVQSLVAAGIVSPLEVPVNVESTPLTVAEDADRLLSDNPLGIPPAPEPGQVDIEHLTKVITEKVQADAFRRERLATLLAMDQTERATRLGRLSRIED
jgi:hypothetical protein